MNMIFSPAHCSFPGEASYGTMPGSRGRSDRRLSQQYWKRATDSLIAHRKPPR